MPAITPPKLHGLISIDAANDRFRVEPSASASFSVILATGDYFIRAYTAEPVAAGRLGAQLVEEIQARIRAAGGVNFAAATCAVSNTGIVTIANAAEDFQMVNVGGSTAWDEANGLAQILGFVTPTTPAAFTWTAPNQHRYGWYPNVAPANFDGPFDRDGPPSSDAVVTIGPDGTVTGTSYTAGIVGRTFHFRYLDEARFWPASATVNQDLETFWSDVIRPGRRFRYYRERDVQEAPAGGAPWTYVGGQKIAGEGMSMAEEEVAFDKTRWRIPIDAHRFV